MFKHLNTWTLRIAVQSVQPSLSVQLENAHESRSMEIITGGSQAYIKDSIVQVGNLPPGDRLAPQEYSNQQATVAAFVVASGRWLVKLQDPKFQGKQLLVHETCMKFMHYATPPDQVPGQPQTIHIKSAGIVGNAVFAQTAFKKGKIIFAEMPLMITQNQNGYASRLNLFYKIQEEQGADSATLKAFQDFSDGGTTHQYTDDARAMFLRMSGQSAHLETSAGCQDFLDKQSSVIAGILARWQSNGHLFPLRGHIRHGTGRDNSLSALYCYVAKLNHSCEPNTRFDVDAGTGRMIVYALRPIKIGEELTSDYIGYGPAFRSMSVEERRELIRPRGFVCMCTKCLRESGEQMPPSARTEGERDLLGSDQNSCNEKKGEDFNIQECDRISEEGDEHIRLEKKREVQECESAAQYAEPTSD